MQKPKGTKDLFGEESKKWNYVQNLVRNIMEKYNYTYTKTPTFERSELFHRGVGDSTDIVRKETYDFKDRGNRDMTLRPEGTAGVVRSYIENKLYADPNKPLKQYYFTSCFRYERPQSGRLREHTQFGVEVFDSASPYVDAEIISIAVNLFKLLGLKQVIVKLNTLGDNESRLEYKKKLVDHFKPHIDELCEDCKERLNINPLRILDCKVDTDNPIMKSAPKTIDYLNKESKEYFEEVKKNLELLEIEYEIDTNMVRGLDYYTHTIFEIQSSIEGFGSQTTLCAGGRYDKLIETLGGPSTPAVGFGMGLERLILALDAEKIDLLGNNNNIDVFVYGMENTQDEMFKITNELRMNGFKTEMDYYNKKLSNVFKQIDRLKATYIVIIGDEELKENKLTIKQNGGQEEKISKDKLVEYLDKNI